MRRRVAIKAIGSITIGAFLLQSCKSEPVIHTDNFELVDGDYTAILYFSNMILPFEQDNQQTIDDRVRYILKALDHTCEKSDIDHYMTGLRLIRGQISKQYSKAPANYENQFLLEYWEDQIKKSDNKEVIHFLTTTKDLCVQHFTTEQFFTNEVLKYQFMPPEYHGCVTETKTVG